MPPRQKTKEKGLEFLAGFLGVENVEDFKQDVDEIIPEKHEIKMLQAEGVLLHLTSLAKSLMPKTCKMCGEAFSTRYVSVAYCGDRCRAKHLEMFGIQWDPKVDHYRNLLAERPLVVGPEAYNCLLELAQRILDQEGIRVDQSLPPVNLLHPAADDADELSEDQDHSSDLPTSPDVSLPELDDPVETLPQYETQESSHQSAEFDPLLD